MKTTITKKLFTLILLISGMFSYSKIYAQGCTCMPSNPAGWCYVNSHGQTKCMKLNHVPDGWRMANTTIESTPLTVSPNPVSNFTTISFFNEQSQYVSIRIFDINGRLVSSLADQNFDEGITAFTWNTEQIKNGVYFLQFISSEKQEMIKLVVTK